MASTQIRSGSFSRGRFRVAVFAWPFSREGHFRVAVFACPKQALTRKRTPRENGHAKTGLTRKRPRENVLAPRKYQRCLYVFHSLNADHDVKFWRCEHQRSEFKCRGRVHTTLNDVVLKIVGEHTCNHSAANVVAQKIVTGIKRRAAETMEPPAAIRAHTLQQIATPLVKRVRHEIELPPPVPLTLQELELPEQYRIYKRTEEAQELFLLADSGTYTEQNREGQQRCVLRGI
ncbi:hypothetical protein niasHT_000087 [Heterodera trifolii]|uniref:FLYWCH-type domain-containing protein n=1 Tax=Heterodera trifolii TaxID=157864 RepID=A0ABD2LVU4_9BILA